MPDSFGTGRFFWLWISLTEPLRHARSRLRVGPDQAHHRLGAAHIDLVKIIFAILLPPLGVFMQVGFAGAFWLNILLTLCGYIPGIVHAVWIIAKR